jgi:predicted ArsR family transcriptional regulator
MASECPITARKALHNYHYGHRYNTDVAKTSPAPAIASGMSTAMSPAMTPKAFTATVSAITSAFGDPTRRAVYLYVRDHTTTDKGVTAAQVADEFDLHPNVARHHLEKLAAGGYLEVSVERIDGAKAGRPSKHYRSVEQLDLEFPVKSDDLVLSLLGKALAALPPDTAQTLAEEVGQEYGQALAAGLTGGDEASGHRSLRSAMQAVADALTAHGFAAHADQRNNQLRIITNHCPFGDVAIENPVICAVDRGMVKGMLKSLYGDAEPVTVNSVPRGDTFCSTAI